MSSKTLSMLSFFFLNGNEYGCFFVVVVVCFLNYKLMQCFLMCLMCQSPFTIIYKSFRQFIRFVDVKKRTKSQRRGIKDDRGASHS